MLFIFKIEFQFFLKLAIQTFKKKIKLKTCTFKNNIKNKIKKEISLEIK